MPEYDRLEGDAEGAGNAGLPVPRGELALQPGALTSLLEVPLELEVQLGRARVPIRDLLELRAGAVVTLDRAATDAVDIYAGGRLIARGEVVSVDGELGVRVTEIIATKGPS